MQEYFRNTINENALDRIRIMLLDLCTSTHTMRSAKRSQERTQDDYSGRFFYELFQNAKDVENCTQIKIILQNGMLLFCNNGEPISKTNFESLCAYEISDKTENEQQTGKYGVGKSCYHEITKSNHKIFSKSNRLSSSFDGYCFELASDKANVYQVTLENLSADSKSPFGNNLINNGTLGDSLIDMLNERDPDALKRRQGLDDIKRNLPIPIDDVPTDISELAENYSTVFYFVPDKFEYIEEKLRDFSAKILDIFLFLPERIKEISVVCNGVATSYYRYTESNLSEYGETRIRIGKECCGEKEERRFFIWNKIASDAERVEIYSLAPEKIKQRDPLKITIALAPDDIDNEGIYFCDLPTEESTGMNLYVDANFHIRSDRKSIHFDNDYNKKLLDFCASTVKDIVQCVLEANNGIPCVETARLITQLLEPGFQQKENSEIYKAIANIIDIINLPCVWATESGRDVWRSPNIVVAPLTRKWEYPITENEFYKRSGLPILASEAKEISEEFVEFYLPDNPLVISHYKSQNILFSFIKDSCIDSAEYIKTWQVIVNNWKDLIDDTFADEEIFLGEDKKLYSGKSVYPQSYKKDLLVRQSVAGKLYPFVELESAFSDFISQHEILVNLLPAVNALNYSRCASLIEHLNATADENAKTVIFQTIIRSFFHILNGNEDLLNRLQFPCMDNEWHTIDVIHQSKGWGLRDDTAIKFLALCGSTRKIICLRSKNAKIWREDGLIEQIYNLVSARLKKTSIILNYPSGESWSFHSNNFSIVLDDVIKKATKYSSQWGDDTGYVSRWDRYTLRDNFLFFLPDFNEMTEEHAKLLFDYFQNNLCKDYKEDVSKRIFFQKSTYSKYNFFIDSPLKLFLRNNDWIPSANGKLIKPTEIYFLEKNLRDRYPNLIKLENISPNVEIKEGMRAFLVTLGAHEVQKETELSYDIVLSFLDKDVKQLNSYLKNFWGLLTPQSYIGVILPQILPVRDSKGKRCFADRNNTKIYIADRTKSENGKLRDFYSPCLDIDLDTFDKLSYSNQSLFIKYSSLPDEYIYNSEQNGEFQIFPLIEFADGLLAFAILLFYNKNKNSVLNEMRRLQLIKVKSITQKIGSIAQEIPHCFQNNAIAAGENDWSWGIAEELHGWKSHINSACIEKILDRIDKITLSEIITFLQGRQVDFDDDDVAEAKELLWGFDKAKKLALQFIPSVRELEDEFAEYNSWEDIESKSLLFDLETLKEFFNSTLPLVQRGKVLAKDYEIDLQEWNTACEELGEGCYVNKQFDSEFNKLRSKKQDFFLTCLLSKTAWQADNYFLYNTLQEWHEFDASDHADKFWQVDDEAFEEIINGFISQNYAAAEQENAVDKPYTIFQKNLEAWEAMEENADIDIYSNDYFLKEYPAEYFEIPPDEPEEDIVEAEEKAAVEESKSTVVPTVSAVKTPSVQAPSAHKVSIDTESVRSRVVKSTNERENHPTVRSVSPTSSEREGATASTAASREKDISEIVNWKKLEVKFTAYKDIAIANGGSNASAPHSQRNYSPSDSGSETENLSDRDKTYIGKHGEECLFAYLNANFDNVKWVSTNNSQGIPGDDSLGYDFEIIDGDGKSQYIECKTTTGATGTAEIHLGPTELFKAQECLPTENYSVYRVFPHGDQLQIVDLGNPLAEGNSVISFCGLNFRWRKS